MAEQLEEERLEAVARMKRQEAEERKRREDREAQKHLVEVEMKAREPELEKLKREEEERERLLDFDQAEKSHKRNVEIQLKTDQRRQQFGEKGLASKNAATANVSDQKVHGADPLVRNDGDIDLEQYLKPLLNAAGGSIQQLELESLRRAYSDGTLQVCGV